MTTSIPLHIRFSPPGRKIALQKFVSVLLAFAQVPLSGQFGKRPVHAGLRYFHGHWTVMISSQPRYDHFDTAAYMARQLLSERCRPHNKIPHFRQIVNPPRQPSAPDPPKSGHYPCFSLFCPTFFLYFAYNDIIQRNFHLFFVHLDFACQSSYNMVYQSASHNAREHFT